MLETLFVFRYERIGVLGKCTARVLKYEEFEAHETHLKQSAGQKSTTRW